MLFSFLPGEFLLHIPCRLHFYLGSFSYTSRDESIFMRGVSLLYLMLTLFMWGVSLTHPVLPSFLCGEFLLHIPCCVDFYAGSFSYTSHVSFFFFFFISGISHTDPLLISFSIKGVSLTHPVLASFLSGVFLLHIPCWLSFYQLTFSYTSNAAFVFTGGVSLTHPVLASFLCGMFL